MKRTDNSAIDIFQMNSQCKCKIKLGGIKVLSNKNHASQLISWRSWWNPPLLFNFLRVVSILSVSWFWQQFVRKVVYGQKGWENFKTYLNFTGTLLIHCGTQSLFFACNGGFVLFKKFRKSVHGWKSELFGEICELFTSEST